MRAKLANRLLVILLVLGLLLPAVPILAGNSAEDTRAAALASDIQILNEKADADGRVTVVIKLKDASLADVEEERVVEELKQQAAQSQKKILDLLDGNGATVLNTFWLTNAVLARVPVGLLGALASLPEVERLYENFTITIPEPLEKGSPLGSPLANVTWGLERIHAPGVWAMGINGSGIRVAVLDTGVDITHPDLVGKMWTDNATDPTFPGGWIEFDQYGKIVVGSTPHDDDGHGTHCSGTVLGGNASGIAIGVAPGAILMHALVLPDGSGTFAQVIAGMQWAIRPVNQFNMTAGAPADVVSMSLGATGFHDAMIVPVSNIRAAGIVPIASIGNLGAGTSGSPGNVLKAFGIGATNITDGVANWSSGQVVNWTPPHPAHPVPYIKPDFSAPGVDVLSSTLDGMWAYGSGTSMAAPHVAGTVALMLQRNPTLDVARVYAILRATAVDLGDPWKDIRYGWGRIDALRAVSLATLGSGIAGVVTDAQTAVPVEDAQVVIS